MLFDVDLAQETLSNDLPDQTENEMFPSFVEIGCSNVDDGKTERFRRSDDKVVVFGHLEVVESS